jgi:hypothetical protein
VSTNSPSRNANNVAAPRNSSGGSNTFKDSPHTTLTDGSLECPSYTTFVMNGTLDKSGKPLPVDSCVPGRPGSTAATLAGYLEWTDRINWWGSDLDEALFGFALWTLVYFLAYSRKYASYARILTEEYTERAHHSNASDSTMDNVSLEIGMLEHRRRMASACVSSVHAVLVTVMCLWVLLSTPTLWSHPLAGVNTAGRFVTVMAVSYYMFALVLELFAVLDAAQLPTLANIVEAKSRHALVAFCHVLSICAIRIVLVTNKGLFFVLAMVTMEASTPLTHVVHIMGWYNFGERSTAVLGVLRGLVFVVVKPANQLAQIAFVVYLIHTPPDKTPDPWLVAWGFLMGLFLVLNLRCASLIGAERRHAFARFFINRLNMRPNALGAKHPRSVSAHCSAELMFLSGAHARVSHDADFKYDVDRSLDEKKSATGLLRALTDDEDDETDDICDPAGPHGVSKQTTVVEGELESKM